MRIFEATVEAGIVRTSGGVVPLCPIMGEGGNSSGWLVIAERKFFYLPKTTPDVKSFLVQAENLCTKLEALCDAIAAITVTCSLPSLPSSTPINAAAFTTAKADIEAIHENLTTLKGALK